MGKKLTHKEIPELEGWLTIPDAAVVMKVSRQYAHRMATNGDFHTLHRVGSTFIVSAYEVINFSIRRGLDKNFYGEV